MIKLITLLKRRPGMSKQDFIAYYEQHHRRTALMRIRISMW